MRDRIQLAALGRRAASSLTYPVKGNLLQAQETPSPEDRMEVGPWIVAGGHQRSRHYPRLFMALTVGQDDVGAWWWVVYAPPESGGNVLSRGRGYSSLQTAQDAAEDYFRSCVEGGLRTTAQDSWG